MNEQEQALYQDAIDNMTSTDYALAALNAYLLKKDEPRSNAIWSHADTLDEAIRELRAENADLRKQVDALRPHNAKLQAEVSRYYDEYGPLDEWWEK